MAHQREGYLLKEGRERVGTITVELFLSDLSEEGIRKFKKAGVFNENWNVFPWAILDFEEEEEVEEGK